MTHTRRIWALPALALTLVLAACSTPEDLNVPTLEPQFGTDDEDRGVDVATISTGRIYSLSEQFGPEYAQTEEGSIYEDGTYSKVLLERRDSSGNVTWSRDVASAQCLGSQSDYDYDNDYDYYYYSCSSVKPISVFADTQGNVSVLTSRSYSYENYDYGYSSEEVTYTIQKYDASGNYVSEVSFYDAGVNLYPIEFAVDGSGNFYVARRDGDTALDSVAKYSTSGGLIWQRTSTVGTPADITVSSSGSVYVAGSTGYARYSSTGGLTWTKTGASEEIIVSGSNIYTRYRTTVRKHDSTGKVLWSKVQSGLSTMIFQAMDGDGSGNVYLSGKYQASSGNFNAMVRKLNSSGTVLFTKTYGTSAYDDALGVATITGSEIYTTGETQGSLSPLTNIGGRDAYLRKFSSTGGTVWTK